MDWNHVKAVLRSSIALLVTAREHLTYTHFINATSLLFSARETLSENHPLRRFLKPHYFGTATVNNDGEKLLLPYYGLQAYVFGTTAEGWNDLVYDSLKSFKYELFPDTLKQKGDI